MAYESQQNQQKQYLGSAGAAITPGGSLLQEKLASGEARLASLVGIIQELEKRLNSCLAPQKLEPSNAQGIPVPDRQSSEVVERMNTINQGIDFAVYQVQSILSRIEL